MALNALTSGIKKPFITEDIGSSFASALTRRMKDSSQVSPAGEELSPEAARLAARKDAQLSRLESALSSTVDYMAEQHGDKAASTMIALVMKRLGNNEINEATLGEAFLDAARFVDANFGIDQGDRFLAHLNGSLNRSMNEFFDNGLNESFMVAPQGVAKSGLTAQNLADKGAASLSEIYTESIKTLLEEARVPLQEAGKGQSAPYGRRGENAAMQGVMADLRV